MTGIQTIQLPSGFLDNLPRVSMVDTSQVLNGIGGKSDKDIVYLDLFSGTGGFAKGLLQAGFRFKKQYYSEIDKHAIANYQYRFPKAQHVGNVSRIKGKSLCRPDIISFGSPCQDISIAGKRKGLKGARSGLFFQAIRLIRECKPRVFVFENVKGIFSSNQGKDFEAVLQAFANLGLYDIQWQLLNTRWFLPQNRERLYLVGTLRKKGRCPVFPLRQNNQTIVKSTEWSKQVSPTIDTSVGNLTNNAPYVLHVPEGTIKGFASAYEGDTVNLAYLNSKTKRGRVGKGTAHTIDTATQQFTIMKGRLRRLTPLDCERLQGFPDGWTQLGLYAEGKKEITDGHRYAMLGNAVSVPCVKAIGKKLRCLFTSDNISSLDGIDTFLTDLIDMKSSSIPAIFSGTSSQKDKLEDDFVNVVKLAIVRKDRHNKTTLEKLAATYGITDRTLVKELTELAIVLVARMYAHQPGTVRERFDRIVALYNQQVNLSQRTSQSILLQQYSTPAPIGYLAGIFCRLDMFKKSGKLAFEPSAGNGLLTIAADPSNVYVNEIDKTRNKNLRKQGYAYTWERDATKPFTDLRRTFEAVITNPPFGRLDNPVYFDEYKITTLEQLMALNALEAMTDNGKAAIIIGGHTSWDELGRVQAGKNRIFFNYLYSRYQVIDVINIDGKKLYSRQGTSFNVRLILIDGRKSVPAGVAPLYNLQHDQVVRSFDLLFFRVMNAMDTTSIPDYPNELITSKDNSDMQLLELEAEALMLKLRFLKMDNLAEGFGSLYKSGINHTSFHKWEKVKEMFNKRKELVLIRNSDGIYNTFMGDAIAIALFIPIKFSQSGQVDGQFVMGIALLQTDIKKYEKQLTRNGYKLILYSDAPLGELGAPYQPASQACIVLNTQVPDSMSFETHTAIDRIRREVGGDMDNFVRHRLGYTTKTDLCKALSAEQIDAVAMAIYNIEARNEGIIIGDQTGIGKGRVAASIIRYATHQGLKPVFLTEKANLFSDIYRDLAAIGSAHLRPFIVNARESKTDIKDEDGNVIYQAPSLPEQQEIFKNRMIPANYDFVLATYSQFNSAEKKPEKPGFLLQIAEDNIFILDEAHNSSGSSNTGSFLQGVVAITRGIVFLSATFAKRPDNMPIYAMKTAIADCTMSKEELVEAISRGGVALQEVLSAQLVAEGQMLRRERSFEGVEVNYISLDDMTEEHRAIADNITEILRDIIAFQKSYITKVVKELDKIAAAEGKEAELRKGTSDAGVDNTPYFSKIFNVINQMLFSLKAQAVAERTIMRLKEGKKPVIAFASTMGSFIETLENETGMPVGDGDTVQTDFSEVLYRGLDGVLRYTEKDVTGKPVYKRFQLSDLAPEATDEYQRIHDRIASVATGITISPIDVIVKTLKEAGYTVAEVTGRKFELQLNLKTGMGLVLSRKKINTNDAFRKFNNNEVDVLMINQSGSTGASAHAIPTAKVSKEQVRPRCMIVLQAELDISTEVQKRGRINRTGQILKPIYDYVTSAIPAEKRLMMMLQKKLKSLDANTTSNQKQSTKILDVPDFLNKYGDKIVVEYLLENPEINTLLDDPLHLSEDNDATAQENAAHKVSGRVAVLSTAMQQEFYNEISQRYNDYVEYLLQIGEYDLEVEAMNLQAETINARVVKMGKGSTSAFGEDSLLETVSANVLRKPFTRSQLENLLLEVLKERDPKYVQQELINAYERDVENRLKAELDETNLRYDELIKEIPSEKAIKKLEGNTPIWSEAIKSREKELNEARTNKLTHITTTANNKRNYLLKLFKFFYPGRNLNYPVATFGEGAQQVPAVFIGFAIDLKKKNPYIPSQVKLRFAIASSNKYLALPASYSPDIMAIIGASGDLPVLDQNAVLTEWETYIQETNVDRKQRHIITGNLLQAFADFKGKLVSYTTIDGQTKKGILLPESWDPVEQVADNVTVPIIKALPLIKSLVQNNQIITSNGMSFFKHGQQYKIVVPGSHIRGGSIYLDKALLTLVEGENFHKTADKMVAHLDERKISDFVRVLQDHHSLSMTVNGAQFREIQKEEQHHSNRKPIILPPPAPAEPMRVIKSDVKKETDTEVSLLELEAQAIAIKLRLLAA